MTTNKLMDIAIALENLTVLDVMKIMNEANITSLDVFTFIDAVNKAAKNEAQKSQQSDPINHGGESPHLARAVVSWIIPEINRALEGATHWSQLLNNEEAHLASAGNKIGAIKRLRERKECSLAAAKSIVERAMSLMNKTD